MIKLSYFVECEMGTRSFSRKNTKGEESYFFMAVRHGRVDGVE